jgi:diguanylate cyclase (GGDEF)-like protein
MTISWTAQNKARENGALRMNTPAGIAAYDEFVARLLTMRDGASAAQEAALLHVSIDHFRATLRTYSGRTDAVLAQLSALLAAATAGRCTVGELGWGEFGILAEPGIQALEVAHALVQRIDDTDFGAAGAGTLYLTASIGIAPVTGPRQELDEILCTADAGARAASKAGGNGVLSLRIEDPIAQRDLHEVRTLPRLREAVRDGRLIPYCQPIVPLRPSNDVLPAAEMLIRIATRSGELLQPAQFLPIAERFRLTSAIDREIVERACVWLESRAKSWVDLDYLTVNLHAQSLDDTDLTDWLVERIATGRFPARRLCIEITESAAIQNLDQAQHLLQRLHDLDCRLALDDFGTGHSSLAQFQALPVDIVKLDGAFMNNVVDDPTSREIVGWVCDLCRAMDRRTVAEHCSTPDILETVRRLGIDYAQGHAVCEPFPLERLLPPLATLASVDGDTTIVERLPPLQSPRNIR